MLTRIRRVLGSMAFAAIGLALAGCFTSETPLISPQNADYPFQRIAFISLSDEKEGGDADQITLVRWGDAYVERNKQDKGRYLFKQVEDDLYIGQISEEDDGELELLYGVVHIQNGTLMSILAPTCDSVSTGVLKAAGIVRTEKKYVDECTVASLDQLKALARHLVGTGIKRETYRIVELVK